MNILLIYPNTQEHGDIPISLTILTAVLKKAHHIVHVFDCSLYTPETDLHSIKESFGMFKAAPQAPISPPPRHNLDNLAADLVNMIKDNNIHLVGITATSGTYPLGLQCSRYIKNKLPEIKVIFGGIHPTICHEEVIKEKSVDMICIGEGEDALVELCNAQDKNEPNQNIQNLWIKENENTIHRNPLRPFKDLDTLPTQDFSGFHEYDFYRPLDGKIYKMLNTEISRGCVFLCHYCSNAHLREVFTECGTYHRRKSPELAIKHLKTLTEKYDFDAIRFWDEDFTAFPASYLKKLSELYKKEIGLPFVVYAGTRTVTEEKIQYLKEMGCITLAMAIESGNYWIRKYILNRDITDEDIIQKYKIVKKSGIRVSAYNMIGLPFETRKMVFDTIALNRKVQASTSSVAAYQPYPKTRLANIAMEFGMLNKTPAYNSVRTDLNSPHMTTEEIEGLVRTFSLYTKLPRKFFPILEKCERDAEFAKKTFPKLITQIPEKLCQD